MAEHFQTWSLRNTFPLKCFFLHRPQHCLDLKRWKPRYYDPNFTDKETKVQGYQVIWVKLHSELLTGAWNTYSESRFIPVISQLLQGSFQVLNVTHCSHLGHQLAHVWVQRTQHLLTFLHLVLIWLRKVLTKAFSNESALHIRWPKYWSFSFQWIFRTDFL